MRTYRQTPLAAEEMGHIRGVLQFILDRHLPYAAVVLDRYSNCLMGNGASEQLMAAVVDPSLLTEHANYLRMAHPLGVRDTSSIGRRSRAIFWQAERELASAGDDEQANALLKELRGYAGEAMSHRSSASLSAGDLLLPIHIRRNEIELRLSAQS